LLPEREVLGDEARPRSEGGAERTKDRGQELEHERTFAEVVDAVTGESALSVG
jgi:hypothetical protein